jgi:hypothetical protein
MRQQRAQRMNTTTPVFRSGTDLPTSGFKVYDGETKQSETIELAA